METTTKKPTAGKGSGRRQEDPKRVRKNWDGIKGFRPSKFN